MLGRLLAVGVAVGRRDGALGLRDGAVGEVGVELADTVEVDARAVSGEPVAHAHLDVVAPVGLDGGSGVLAVDRHHLLGDAVRGASGGVLDVEVVLARFTRVGPCGYHIAVNAEAAPASSRRCRVGAGRRDERHTCQECSERNLRELHRRWDLRLNLTTGLKTVISTESK